jgi:WD40 repeat protein
VWSALDLRPVRNFKAYNSAVTSLAFSPDGTQLATGNELNVIMLWSLSSDTNISRSFSDSNSVARSIAASPDGKMIALGDADGKVVVFDARTRSVIKRLVVAPVCPLKLDDFKGPYHPCYLNVITFSQDGSKLVVASSGGNIGRWDTRTWAHLGDPLDADVPCRSLVCDNKTLTSAVAFNSDLSLVAVGGNRQIWVWDSKNKALKHSLKGHGDAITSLAFSSDGRLLASGSKDKTIALWDLRNGQRIGKPLKGHDGAVKAIVFNPRRRQLASNSSDNTVRLWDLNKQEQLAAFPNDTGYSSGALTFSRDGKYLATMTAKFFVTVWDTTTYTAFPTAKDPVDVMAVAFSQASNELLSASNALGPTFVTLHDYEINNWKERACGIVQHNLDLKTINLYTLGETRICPALPVDGSVVRAKLDTAHSHVNEKDSAAASAAFREAALLAMSNDNDDAELGHLVCLHGAISRHARDVLLACDHAVELSPDAGAFFDSRGVARALTGDYAGAIQDFQFFVDWSDRSGLFRPNVIRTGLLEPSVIAERRAWIAQLRLHKDPFTPKVLTTVWNEYLQSQGGNVWQTCPVFVGSRIEWVQRPVGC